MELNIKKHSKKLPTYDEFLAFSNDDKKSYWLFYFTECSHFPFSLKSFFNLYQEHIQHIPESIFFVDYVQSFPYRRSDLVRQAKQILNFFIEHSSVQWLTDSNSFILEPFLNILLKKQYNHFLYKDVIDSFRKKITNLPLLEIDLFLKRIDLTQEQNIEFLCILCRTLNKEKFDFIYRHYFLPLSSSINIDMGWQHISHNPELIDSQYYPLMIQSLNHHLSNAKSGVEFGHELTIPMVKNYFHLYDKLDPQYRDFFIAQALSQKLNQLKEDSVSFLSELLILREEKIVTLPMDFLVFSLWKACHIIPKDKKQDMVDLIIQHAHVTNEWEELKTIIFNSDNVIHYGYSESKMNHHVFINFLKNNILFQSLNNDLPISSHIIRNKI